MNISAILLAAGLSQRMAGQDKLLLSYNKKSLLQHAIDLLDSLPCREKIIVTTKKRLDSVCIPPPIIPIINPSPQTGQSGSLRLGLETSTGDSYLFLNADQPRLTFDKLQTLFDLAQKNPDKIIYPSVNGKPTTPALFPACFRKQLLELRGDTGGRLVRKANPEACLSFEVDSPDCFMDIDRPEDLTNL